MGSKIGITECFVSESIRRIRMKRGRSGQEWHFNLSSSEVGSSSNAPNFCSSGASFCCRLGHGFRCPRFYVVLLTHSWHTEDYSERDSLVMWPRVLAPVPDDTRVWITDGMAIGGRAVCVPRFAPGSPRSRAVEQITDYGLPKTSLWIRHTLSTQRNGRKFPCAQ